MNNQRTLICNVVDNCRKLIMEAEQHIFKNPETGFKEWETNRYMREIFEDLGYSLTEPKDIPGFYTDVHTGMPGPMILVLCEMDALLCEEHPDAVQGTVHACGHNAQCAAMAGIAAALKTPGILDDLCGTIRLMVVPAEELIEVSYRENLRKEGTISFLGGKIEFMHRGYMDGVDIAFMLHTASNEDCDFSCNLGGNGFVVKTITFKGKAAHAGSAPEKGINALYAANMALQAINALRETFGDEEHIRVHPIITSGGASVNIIPAEVQMESYIRGASMKTIREVNQKVNRALFGSALAVGADVVIQDSAGYAPLRNDVTLMEVAKTCMEELVGTDRVKFRDFWSRGSTDMGNLSCVIPSIHAFVSGSSGVAHSKDFHISDPERACVNSARAQLLMLHTLLSDNGKKAYDVMSKFGYDAPTIAEHLQEVNDLNGVYRSTYLEQNGKISAELCTSDI